MFQFLINPWLLAALAGVSLPIIAHLLSRRRFDVVPWAAMQFLDPAKKTRRRMKLEELLLLLLRIGLIVLLAVAAARPWIPGGWLSGFHSSGARALVLVIDGSHSMTRTDGLNSLHQNAIRRATEFLETLSPGDEVALVDCRDQPRTVIDSPLQDTAVVIEQLQSLPPPGGFSDLHASVEQAIAILGRSSATAREVVVFTDRQRSGWMPDNQPAWERVDEMLKFPAVRPRVWVVDVARQLSPMEANVAVGTIELSRELTVPGFPLRFRTTLYNAADTPVTVPVTLKLDGQMLAEQRRDVDIPGGGEVTVEFEHMLRQVGTRVISVAVDPPRDAIASDNESHAAVHVVAALPVLLVNGRPSPRAAERATFFAEVALSGEGDELPWVSATQIDAAALTPQILAEFEVVVLCDVATLPPGVPERLVRFVGSGKGVLVCCGENSSVDGWSAEMEESGLIRGLELVRVREAALNTNPVHPEPLSLVPGWLSRFRSDPGRSFLKSEFRQWWLVTLSEPLTSPEVSPDGDPVMDSDDLAEHDVGAPAILARLTTGDPLLIESRLGKGTVITMTSGIDRAWNDLPTRADYVPFLHEAIFATVSGGNQRNVKAGQPLVTQLAVSGLVPPTAEDYTFVSPGGDELSPAGRALDAALQLSTQETLIPGQYELRHHADAAVLDRYVVNYDSRENDAEELSGDDRARLVTNDRLRFSDSLGELAQQMYGDESRAELWALLMFAFLAMLVLEVWMTQRIVERGYGE